MSLTRVSPSYHRMTVRFFLHIVVSHRDFDKVPTRTSKTTEIVPELSWPFGMIGIRGKDEKDVAEARPRNNRDANVTVPSIEVRLLGVGKSRHLRFIYFNFVAYIRFTGRRSFFNIEWLPGAGSWKSQNPRLSRYKHPYHLSTSHIFIMSLNKTLC